MAELVCGMLPVVMGNHHGTYHEVALHKLVTQAKYVLVVGDTEVSPDLILLDVLSTDDNHNLNAFTQLCQHAQLTVRLEARQYARGMVVVEELTAQFHV